MFETVYGLSHQPFAATPNPLCCAAVKSMKTAFDTLSECLRSGQGIGILTSSSGLGKSLLCQALAESLTDSYHAIYLPSSNYQSSHDLLQSVLCHLEMPFKDLSDQELRLDITRALISVLDQKQNGTLLFIDEAENLEEEILEEIRSLSNLMVQGKPLIRIVLSGQMELEEKLISPTLASLHQRIGCQTSLEPLSRQETRDYIEFRIQWAGGTLEQVFTQAAIDFISQVSDGIPRCINAICEHSLTHGARIGEKPIDINAVMLAFEQLKQLPLRWNDPQQSVGEEKNPANQSSDFSSDFTDDSVIFDETADSNEDSNYFEVGCDLESAIDSEYEPTNKSEYKPSIEPEYENSVQESSDGVVTFEVGADSEEFSGFDENPSEESPVMEVTIPETDQPDTTQEEIIDDSCSSYETPEPDISLNDFNSDHFSSVEGAEKMNDEKMLIEADYCVPEGDGWTTFDPDSKRNPIQIIEELESALESISVSENLELVQELVQEEQEISVKGFTEEVVIDPYAALDAHAPAPKKDCRSIRNEESGLESESETIVIKVEENLKITGSRIKENQTTRLDPAEIRKAMKNDNFDVIVPEKNGISENPAPQLNQPKFISKKQNRQEI